MKNDAIDAAEALLNTHQSQGLSKLQAKLEGVEVIDQKLFFYLFAITTRWFEKSQVQTSDSPFWQKADTFGVMSHWQWPSIARLYLLLRTAEQSSKEDYVKLYSSLFDAADVQESIVLIQSLAFVPHAEAFVEKAREGARSNITTLFSAVAHNTDYPFKHFDESGWNQLILKAAFLAVPIASIYGLKERNNAALVTMLCDYARERQAASRVVPWDLWCCVAWAAHNEDNTLYLKDQFQRGDVKSKAAIALGLMENSNSDAASLGHELSKSDALLPMPSPLTWEAIAKFDSDNT